MSKKKLSKSPNLEFFFFFSNHYFDPISTLTYTRIYELLTKQFVILNKDKLFGSGRLETQGKKKKKNHEEGGEENR